MGRRLNPGFWKGAITPRDELSMTMILDDVDGEEDMCTFQSCRTSLSGIASIDGGRECPSCYRRSVVFDGFSQSQLFLPEGRRTEQLRIARRADLDNDLLSDPSQGRSAQADDGFVQKPAEDIELYYSIQFNQTIPGSAVNPIPRNQSDATTSRTIVRPVGSGSSYGDIISAVTFVHDLVTSLRDSVLYSKE
jgi:hypothetical protein